MFSLVVCVFGILLFIPIKSNSVNQLRKKREHQNQIGEFDLTSDENLSPSNIVQQAGIFAKNLGGKLETNLGRTYEFLGHKVADLGSQLEQNRNNLSAKATDIYKGSFAVNTGIAYENFQIGYGKMGDRLSSLLKWIGENVIKLGHNTASIIRISFHTIGDIVGGSVDKTEHLIGDRLIQGAEKVHTAAIDLQRTSHTDSENVRRKLEQTAPKFQHTLTQIISKLSNKIQTIGLDTESAGEVIEQHHFLDTLKQAYHK